MVAPTDARGDAASDTKRLTLRWRSSDQYPLRGYLECSSGVASTWVESCGVVSTAFHSSARLCVSSATSSLDSFLTCSIVAVGRALPAAPAALAEPGAPQSTADAYMRAHSVSKRYVCVLLKSWYPANVDRPRRLVEEANSCH